MRQIDFKNFEHWGADDRTWHNCENFEVDVSKPIEEIDFLLKYDNAGLLPRGDILAFTGKAKSGKSFSISIIIAALLKGELDGFKALNPNSKVLLLDTEMHRSNVAKRAKATLKLTGMETNVSNPNFKVLSLRELDYKARFLILEEAIEDYRPDIVFLDGVSDIVRDFNDLTESKEVVNRLMKLSSVSNCAIICLLHENKSVLDKNMRGHLGTELTNKCSEVYSVHFDKSSNQYRVEQTLCRNKPISDWAFSINEDGVPKIEIVETPITKGAINDISEANAFEGILTKSENVTYSKLVDNYSELMAVSKPTAKRHISKWVERGILKKEGDFYKFIKEKGLL